MSIKEAPLVSVVLTTFNRSNLVTRAIRSVLNQTYENLEIIVVDDCSDDDTEEIVKSIRDDRLRYFRNKRNEGASSARNRGIDLSRGDYVAFQDDDDEWLPDKLESQVEILSSAPDKVGLVYCKTLRRRDGEEKYFPRFKKLCMEGDIHNALLVRNLIITPAALVRKICLKKVGGFDTGLEALVEWELWIRFSKEYEVRYIDRALLISYETEKSISSDYTSAVNSLVKIVNKHKMDMGSNQKALSRQYRRLGEYL
ncbi:MAG: glycosyltransferase family 2 protein, partial [Methanomassiliicoccales archaeon]